MAENGKTQEELGRELRENNEKIVHCLLELKAQRDELLFLVQKQNEERKKLEMEMERLTYKLCLINKSMAQRMKAKQNYDVTIEEIEEKYKRLKENCGDLMVTVTKNCNQLDSLINKTTSTDEVELEVEISATHPNKVLSEDTTSHESGSAPSDSSHSSDSKNNDSKNNKKNSSQEEDCVCLPNKDGKCIREKTASKMIQAAPSEAPDVPIKLEKSPYPPTPVSSPTTSNKSAQEKAAQTPVTGEPQGNAERSSYDSSLVDPELENQRSKLTKAATQYKETSLRRSL